MYVLLTRYEDLDEDLLDNKDDKGVPFSDQMYENRTVC